MMARSSDVVSAVAGKSSAGEYGKRSGWAASRFEDHESAVNDGESGEHTKLEQVAEDWRCI